ncbi:MAG: FecR domain-containing protein [Acidobacteriota bacterium]
MNENRKTHPSLQMQRKWYTLSVDTLRGWAMFFLLIALVAGALLGYRAWERYALRWEARDLISQARELAERVRRDDSTLRYRSEYETGLQYLSEARQAEEREDFRRAVTQGTLSRNVLLAILDTLDRAGRKGEASFIAVQGNVEFRRGETGGWQGARSRTQLRPGDFVRTSDTGSAQILFNDGTLYTVRKNTSFIVSDTSRSGGGERTLTMQYGWVNLDTAELPAVVEMPSASARVRQASEAYVGYEADLRRASFSAFEGSVEVASEDGETRQLGELQRVQQVDQNLGRVRSLPARVEILEPAHDLQLDADRAREMSLAWRPVAGASRYALQVSRNPLFVDNVIDVEDRRRSGARIGIRGPGSFLWRVAAVSAEEGLGPWSEPRRFQIASLALDEEEDDEIPPPLELEEASAYGSIVLVTGRTEPGALVEVDGEPILVAADGSFTKTIQLANEGWSFIQVRARDAWGNETAKRKQVFIDPV